MQKLVKNSNLVLGSLVLAVVMALFSVTSRGATTCGHCASISVGFWLAAVTLKVIAYCCILASALLIVASVLNLLTAAMTYNFACYSVNLLVLVAFVLVTAKDMVRFIMFG